MSSVGKRVAIICETFVNMSCSVNTHVAVTWIRDGRW